MINLICLKDYRRSRKMSNLLDIVQQEAKMDEDKLRVLCSQKNIWDYFGIEKDIFESFRSKKDPADKEILL